MNTPCMYCYATADRCAAEDPHGFVCNRLNGHDGDHAACDGDDHPISTWPQRGETTGEALSRLQAELTRLLDEAAAELRDEADGGVTAALIEKEAENADPTVDYHAMWWKAEREREKAERERDEARADLAEYVQAQTFRAVSRPLTPDEVADEVVERARAAWINVGGRVYAGLTIDLRHALAAALPATPDAMTAREHLDAAWEAAHAPADGMIPAATEYMVRFRSGTYAIRKSGPEPVDAESAFTRRLLDPPRPEGAEKIDEHLRQANAAALGGALTPEQRRALADHLAGFGYRTPIALTEDGAA